MGANRAFGNMEPADTLQQALMALAGAALNPRCMSDLWCSPAWPPGRDAPDYCNAVILVDPGAATPAEVLARLHRIEADFGRVRDPTDRWASRTLDLDLIDHNGLVLAPSVDSFPAPVLPHLRAQERDFVLGPLLQVMPYWRHPVTGERGTALLERVRADLPADRRASPLINQPAGWSAAARSCRGDA